MCAWQGLGARHLAEAGFEAAYTLHEELSETCLPRMLAAGMRRQRASAQLAARL